MSDEEISWPEHIAYALARYEDPRRMAAEQVASFAQRWGGLDLIACMRAQREGDKDDKLFALFALSHLEAEPARTLVRELLQSNDPKERWVSAIGLGEKGDKHALPALCAMLTEFMPETEDELPSEEVALGFYASFRGYAPEIIGRLGELLAVPALRQAVELLVRRLHQHSFRPIDAFPDGGLINYEDDIIYALGRLGAFGALTGLVAAEPWLRLWTLHLIMGHLHGAYPWRDMVRWRYHPELEMDIRHLLMFQYGFNPDEQDAVLDHYERTKLRELDIIYEIELAREQGDLKW